MARKISINLCLVKRRKIHLCLITLVVIFIVGYIGVVDVAQESILLLHWAGSTGPNTARDGAVNDANLIEAYCHQRKQTGDNSTAQQNGDVNFLYKPNEWQEGQSCIHPHLVPCDPNIAIFDQRVRKVECSTDENWVYVDNGTFRISTWARWKYGKITCDYAPIVRDNADYKVRHAELIKNILDGSPLVSDFFEVDCRSPAGKRYHNIHAGVAYNETLHSRSRVTTVPREALGYDVFLFGFDSTSRMSWVRNLPKSRDYFLRVLGGMELEGYNIVGDGTVQALLPILTGHTEHDLPPARRGDTGAVEVDHFPWIWDEFKRAGYVTAWAEDMSYIGTFQMRLKGFREQPTDHSMRTYFLMAEPMYRRFLPWCAGSEVRHQRFLNWFRDLYHMYGNKPKFMFGFHSEYSHNSINDLKKIDEDFRNFMQHLHHHGYLEHTILILMGDHGGRFSELRGTAQGKLEERLPYFAFSFPPSLIKSHPEAIMNFKINTKRLTTPFDIHETFLDMLNVSRGNPNHVNERGISLFKEVPKNRTCMAAGIEPHWCSCLHWDPVKEQDTTARRVVESVVGFINEMTLYVREMCALLKVGRIVSLYRFAPNTDVLRFKQSSDRHGDLPDMSDNMTIFFDHYQVSLFTEPGHGHFEVTVKHSIQTDELYVSQNDISRINPYHDAPSCIQSKYPHLRSYCYCV